MSGKLSSKVALITGGSRGIGRAAALAFAREGAALIGVHYGTNTDAAAATIREIERLGAKAVAIKADLRGGKEATDSLWEQFSRAAVAATGEPRLDILVNNAGVAPAVSLAQTSESIFVKVYSMPAIGRMNVHTSAHVGRRRISPMEETAECPDAVGDFAAIVKSLRFIRCQPSGA
ncbi:SDR family NAD(P)-dependent oxidoreductase [Trinickia acidisoli]|uniref:SDR family NAD(P)-dependent oxidoreductase n=1 Tax=Trinickia acidisoli TaxID=2767482 RepID=UPI00241406BA|nr:SDR family NAD(P)-dependent oxidoreductase [Trinickia acidisoli]